MVHLKYVRIYRYFPRYNFVRLQRVSFSHSLKISDVIGYGSKGITPICLRRMLPLEFPANDHPLPLPCNVNKRRSNANGDKGGIRGSSYIFPSIHFTGNLSWVTVSRLREDHGTFRKVRERGLQLVVGRKGRQSQKYLKSFECLSQVL